MSVLPLVTAFNNLERLLTPTQIFNFEEHDGEARKEICVDLVESLYHHQGLGISANQLGLPYSAFAMRGNETDLVCFNPRVVVLSDETVELEEGCLSFPGLVLKISRARHCRVRYQDPYGETKSVTFANLTARVFQHEMYHLAGKMWFAEKVSKLKLEHAIKKAKKKYRQDYTDMGLIKYV